MNNPAKGGRGKKAPYNTTHYRIPEPLKALVEEIAANYRELISDYDDPNDPKLITEVLKAVSSSSNQPAIEILLEAKKLKANAGGAIKSKIDEALELL